MPIKVRVGQSDAIKILSSAGGGSINAQTAKNVIGGIASVTQLSVSGISTLGNVDAGIITATSFVGPLTGDVTGTADLALGLSGTPNINVGAVNAGSIRVAGLSTFVGVVTTTNDLFVGGNLFVNEDITLDEINARNLNITGLSTFKEDAEFKANVSIGGTLTFEDVTNVDSVGLITAREGIVIDSKGLIVTAGVSTFNDDLVLKGQNTNARWNYSTSDLTLFDNTRLVFGDNTDFQIWHGGAHTFLKNTGGDLRIRGNKILLKTEDDGETYIEANANQDVKLFYNNNEKLATASDGVNITGTLTAGLIDGGSF